MFEHVVSQLPRRLAKRRKARPHGVAPRRLGFESLEGRRVLSAATHFALVPVAPVPATVTAGQTERFTLTALDRSGALADPPYQGTVHFTCSDPQAAPPLDYTFSIFNRTDTWGFVSVTFKTAGSWTVTAIDTLTPSITGTSTPATSRRGRRA